MQRGGSIQEEQVNLCLLVERRRRWRTRNREVMGCIEIPARFTLSSRNIAISLSPEQSLGAISHLRSAGNPVAKHHSDEVATTSLLPSGQAGQDVTSSLPVPRATAVSQVALHPP